MPLSVGTVANGDIVCPCHAIELDPADVCRENPRVQGAPEHSKDRDYPQPSCTAWVWIGDSALADTGLIPDYSWFNTPESFNRMG